MEEYIQLQRRNDEIWGLLEDPELPPLDRLMLNEELINNTFEILRFEDDLRYENEDDVESCDSQSIGPDEYDREGVIIYGQPDFM